MSRQFYYLVSTLPMLRFDAEPALSTETFLAQCRQQLPPDRCSDLEGVGLALHGSPCCRAEARWQAFETCVRNVFVRIRAAARGIAPAPWLAEETDVWPGAARRIEEAMKQQNPAERERALDRLRWDFLEDLTVGHRFDFDGLVVYRLQLLLAEKRAARSTAEGEEVLAHLVGHVFQQAERKRTLSE